VFLEYGGRVFVLFVCIIVGPIGTYVEFFLLFNNNLLMNCRIVRMCFGCWVSFVAWCLLGAWCSLD